MSQAGNTGMIMQQRFGDQNQIDSQNQQQLANMLLRNALSAPQRPELSWTQGLARMLEAGVSAYKQNQLTQKNEAIQQQQGADAKILGAALSSGDPRQVAMAMQQMKNPQSQNMALNILSNMGAASQAQNYNLQTKAIEHKFGKENKGIDYIYKGAENEQGAQNASNLSNQNAQQDVLKKGAEIQGESGRDIAKVSAEATKDPIKNAQAQVFQLQNVVNSNSPDATPEIKALAQKKLDAQMQILTQLKPNSPYTDPNAGMTSGSGMAGSGQVGGRGSGSAGGSKAGGAGGAPDIQSLATSARDQLAVLKQSMQNIETGNATNTDFTPLGKAANYGLAAAGMNNHEAAVNLQAQAAAQATLEKIQEFQRNSTGSSRLPKTLIDLFKDSTFSKDELPESAYPKMFMQMQALDRIVSWADLQQQWINKNGGIDKKDKDTAATWEQANSSFMNANPIISYDDYLKNNKQGLIMTQNGQAQPAQPKNQNQQSEQTQPQVNIAEKAPEQTQPKDVALAEQDNPGSQTPTQTPDISKPPLAPTLDSSQIPIHQTQPQSQSQQQTPQNNPYTQFDQSQSLQPSQGSPIAVNAPMDQQQMLALALANKQPPPQPIPDYSSQFANSPNMSF